MKHNKIILLGGSGFVGRHLAVELAQRGHQVSIPCRRPHRMSALKVVPGIRLIEGNITDAEKLPTMLQGHDAVINLVGILNESGNNSFRRLHVDFVKTMVNACQKQKIRRILHVSALGADQASGSSNYLRSKGEGENLLHTFGQNDLQVTSFQPSVIFGADDSFINRFAGILKLCFGLFPLACANSRFAPVYIEDVVSVITDAVEDQESWGRRYPLCGPETYTLQQLVEMVGKAINSRCKVVALPDFLARIQAVLLQNLPGKLFTMDNYRSLQTPSTCGEPSPGCNTSFARYVEDLTRSQDSRRGDYDRYRQQLPRD